VRKDKMEIVHGFNTKRKIVKKELHVSKKLGAFLRYKDEDTIIEPDINVWNKVYRPNEDSEGFLNAFYVITNKCNKHCKYCYNRYLLEQNPGNISINNLVKSLEEFVPVDPRDLSNISLKEYVHDRIHPMLKFIGGEPTVAETLVPFINYITNTRQNKIYIYTNGIKLLDIDYLKQFENTNKIMWSISTDKNTSEKFIRSVTENLIKYNFEYGYNIIVGRTENTIQKNLKLDKVCRSYEPQEIRYRALADQIKGYSDYLSSVMKFIERARDIPYDYYLNNANIGHGGYVSILSHNKSENPNTGDVAIAVLPVWKRTFAEALCKWGSFVINTKGINTPGECHINSVDLFKFRMKHTKDYITEGTKIIWGKINPYC
jgi:MoaA/NifB/PqqE/SkfB family radical SAM enzyme